MGNARLLCTHSSKFAQAVGFSRHLAMHWTLLPNGLYAHPASSFHACNNLFFYPEIPHVPSIPAPTESNLHCSFHQLACPYDPLACMAPRMVPSPRDDHAVIHSSTRQPWPIKGRRKEVHRVGSRRVKEKSKKEVGIFVLKKGLPRALVSWFWATVFFYQGGWGESKGKGRDFVLVYTGCKGTEGWLLLLR